MEVFIKNEDSISICGYMVETTHENNDRDIAKLWLHKSELLCNSVDQCLYGVFYEHYTLDGQANGGHLLLKLLRVFIKLKLELRG